MSRVIRILCILSFILLAVPRGAVSAETPVLVVNPVGVPEGIPSYCVQEDWVIQSTSQVTETILTCAPPAGWNGSLVVFAHGYEFDYPQTASPTLPYEQIVYNDGKWSMPMMINAMGFAFATTSYTKNGLAVQQGVDSILRLVDTVQTKLGGNVQQVYVIGASEGGLITTLLVERHPEVFTAGMAVCA